MLQTSPKASATAAPDIFPPALKSTQVCFRMNIERGKRLVFFGVIRFVELKHNFDSKTEIPDIVS